MGIIILILSLALLMLLCFKGVPVFYAAFLAGLFLLVVSGVSPADPMIKNFATGLSGYFGNFFFIFIFGALFGKLTEVSGAADSIAQTVVKRFGDKYIILAIIIAEAILTYGGVSVFVAFFAVYPMMLSLFRKTNLSRTLIPAVYFAGAGTFTGPVPGSPQIHNLIPMKFLGTTSMAGAVPGFITAGLETILVLTYVFWAVNNSRKKGLVFEMTKEDEKMRENQNSRRLPGLLIALAPMITLLVLLNGARIKAEIALFCSVAAALISYFKFIEWKKIWSTLESGLFDGVRALFVTAAMVGFGALVELSPGFQTAINWVTNIGGNPLVAGTLTVAVLAGLCGSGSGGLGIAMPIIQKYFVPMGVNVQALHRSSVFAAFTLDSLPHNGLIIMVMGLCGVNHKNSYGHIFILTVLIPIICTIFIVTLYTLFPGVV